MKLSTWVLALVVALSASLTSLQVHAESSQFTYRKGGSIIAESEP